MTVEEAITGCEFWTENVSETQMWGSTGDDRIANFFGCTVSVPRERWTKPDGPRCYEVRVGRYLTVIDPDDPTKSLRDENGYVMRENELYVKIRAEIERRQAAGLRG